MSKAPRHRSDPNYVTGKFRPTKAWRRAHPRGKGRGKHWISLNDFEARKHAPVSSFKSLILTLPPPGPPTAAALWRKIDGNWRCTRATPPLLWMVGCSLDLCKSNFGDIEPIWTEATPHQISLTFPSLIHNNRQSQGLFK